MKTKIEEEAIKFKKTKIWWSPKCTLFLKEKSVSFAFNAVIP